MYCKKKKLNAGINSGTQAELCQRLKLSVYFCFGHRMPTSAWLVINTTEHLRKDPANNLPQPPPTGEKSKRITSPDLWKQKNKNKSLQLQEAIRQHPSI